MANPFAHSSGGPLLSGGYHDVSYHYNAILPGDHDLFTVRQRSSFSLWSGPVVAASVSWGTVLFVGPDRSGLDPASVFTWFMQSIQFEYGLLLGVSLPHPVDAVVFEYGRTSQHPLLGGYSEISSDVIRASVWLQTHRIGKWEVDAGVRVAYVDLLPIWKSVLDAPRTMVLLEPTMDAGRSIGSSGAGPFIRLHPRVHVTRVRRQWPWADVNPRLQLEIDAEIGLRSGGATRIEVFADLYSTPDSEQVRGAAAPVTTVGLGFRLVTSAKESGAPQRVP